MIDQNTVNFLIDLKKHNERSWFIEHKSAYKAAYENLTDLTAILLHNIAAFDEIMVGVQLQDCIFRIYRDVRFAKDKSPYKTWLSAFMSNGGRRGLWPGYYIQLEPGNTYLAGGIWHPEKNVLDNVRAYIAAHPAAFEKIVLEKTFINQFGEISGEQLKTAPKGYAKDHPQIKWLRYKDYLVSCNKNEVELTGSNLIDEFINDYKAMYPFIQYLRKAISTYSG